MTLFLVLLMILLLNLLIGGSSLYLRISLSTNCLPLWSGFRTMKKGFGRGVCCGETFSLLYSRVCCIIGLEKNISGFLLSLSLSSHGGKLFERNLLFIKQLGTNLGFFFIFFFIFTEWLSKGV